VRVAINKLRSTKASGYDLITGEILKKLPEVGLSVITYIYNSILRTGYFPGQWKVSQIVTILEPGKPAEDVSPTGHSVYFQSSLKCSRNFS